MSEDDGRSGGMLALRGKLCARDRAQEAVKKLKALGSYSDPPLFWVPQGAASVAIQHIKPLSNLQNPVGKQSPQSKHTEPTLISSSNDST